MVWQNKVVKITAIINKGVSPVILDALKVSGLQDLNMATGRMMILEEQRGVLAALSFEEALASMPADVLSFLVSPELEEGVLNLIVEKGRLDEPGRGSVFSEDVDLLKAHELCQENRVVNFESDVTRTQANLMGICCIVQRGHSDALSRVVLDAGTCVPAVTFGEGTGLRDKLGLLRITIPAEKGIINVVANAYDAESVMDMMIDVGKLDQVGKGFIYMYPVKHGVIDKKINYGMARHVASIEQIISAVDSLMDSVAWRRRGGVLGDGNMSQGNRAYLTDLLDVTLICDEGRGEDLVRKAMDAGAAGATLSKQKHFSLNDVLAGHISPARETCSMIVGEAQVEQILEAIEAAGAFDDHTHGQVLARPVPKACTYLGK
jgi:nitrogen regulatory protein PII